MTIQRMTILSGLFVLIGLILFVSGRNLILKSQKKAYALIFSGLVVCTMLAAFAKENGALLPFYALVIELTVFRTPTLQRTNLRIFKFLRLIIFSVPFIALFSYITFNWQGILNGYETRSFIMSERIATESIILWEYVRQIVIPDITTIGPFHDNYIAVKNWPISAIMASSAWVLLFLSAIILRNKAPAVSGGILWFIFGHSLESSIYPLELYFEHRNYLPSLGILLILGHFLTKAGEKIQLKQKWIFSIYPIFLSALLFQVTSLWGNPSLAAKVWFEYNPTSERAIQNHAKQLINSNNFHAAYRTLYEGYKSIESISLALQSVRIACLLEDKQENVTRIYNEIIPVLSIQPYTTVIPVELNTLVSEILSNRCPHLTLNEAENILQALILNEDFQHKKLIAHFIHFEMARISRERGNLDKTISHLKSSYYLDNNPEILSAIVKILLSAGLPNEAQEWVDNIRGQSSSLALLRQRTIDKKLRELEKLIRKVSPKRIEAAHNLVQ